MAEQKILVPNIGDFKEVEVIEVLVKEGQEIKKDDSVITLESDKSSVEVPSNFSGIVKKINIKVGDKISEGTTILSMDSKENNKEKILQVSENKNNKSENKSEIIEFPIGDKKKRCKFNFFDWGGKNKTSEPKYKKVYKRIRCRYFQDIWF